MTAASASYGLAATAFLLLGVFLLVNWRGRAVGAWLAAATGASALWAGTLAWLGAPQDTPYTVALEILRDGAWFVFLLKLLGAKGARADRRARIRAGIIAALCLLPLATEMLRGAGLLSEASGHRFALAGALALSVIGLMLVEQLYRNTLPEGRWQIKYLCLALAGMFAYDFYFLADALLFRVQDPQLWLARGLINTLLVPLLLVAAARNPDWSLPVAVSRKVVFHTASLFAAGAYLLLMAGAGYWLQWFGGEWGTVLRATFLFAALLLLAVVALSGTWRARLKVFLSKHFYSYRYDYREEWLRFTGMLSEGGADGRPRERVIEAMANLVESPGGALWLEQSGGMMCRAAHWNLSELDGAEAADGEFCRHLREHPRVLDLAHPGADAFKAPGWIADNPRAWLVAPLAVHERLIGFMVLARPRTRIDIDWEVYDLLKTAAQQAAAHLAQMQSAEALIVARQFESFHRMAAYVVHDLKNLVTQLSLMLENAEKHKHNPEFQEDMIATVDNSVARMNKLLTQLKAGPDEERRTQVELGALLRDAIASKSVWRVKPALHAACDAFVQADRGRLLRALGNVIQNALEATPHDGSVRVELARDGGFAHIAVADSGAGMEQEFIRERLFRPFDSTKGKGMGIGAYEVREYVRELGGRIQVQSAPGQGTRFSLWLPLDRTTSVAEDRSATTRSMTDIAA
jgi:putative PEP-CTERM system histidine kinase